jgi:outer membrane protein assembly factor BamB
VVSRRPLARPGGGGPASGIAISGDQIIVGRATARGDDVFDLDTGRLRWSYETAADAWFFGCGPARLCSVGGDGVRGYDADTGRPVWGIAEFNTVFGLGGPILVIGGLDTVVSLTHQPELVAVDTRTGAVLNRLGGWIGTDNIPDGRIIVAHDDPGAWTGHVGLYDPRTGRVEIVGRGGVGPTPRCGAGSGVVACLGNGLTVWRLP